MNQDCLDIGIIQAFLDAELDHVESGRVSAHISSCSSCAVMLGEADEESAVVFSALDREFNTLVPTHRLWNRINDAIESDRESRPFYEKIWAYLRTSLVSPSVLAAASLLLVFGLTAILFLNKSQNAPATASNQPVGRQSPPQTPVAIEPTAAASTPISETGPTIASKSEKYTPRLETAIYRPEARQVAASRLVERASSPAEPEYMPGEVSYVKTISTLRKTVDEQKDGVLGTSERVAYERNMAIVDDTISKMRGEVKKNPRNETARQVLYASYQNKIDLLNSVAEKEELVASLK